MCQFKGMHCEFTKHWVNVSFRFGNWSYLVNHNFLSPMCLCCTYVIHIHGGNSSIRERDVAWTLIMLLAFIGVSILCPFSMYFPWFPRSVYHICHLCVYCCVYILVSSQGKLFQLRMMTSWYGNAFRISGPLWEVSNARFPHRGLEIWSVGFCCCWCWPEQTVENSIELPVIWDAMTLTRRH